MRWDRQDGCCRWIDEGEHATLQFQHRLHFLCFIHFVMDVGGDDHLVLLYKETRCLQADHEILPRDDLHGGFANLCLRAHDPGTQFPGGEVFRQIEIQFAQTLRISREIRHPHRTVGEVGSNHGLR